MFFLLPYYQIVFSIYQYTGGAHGIYAERAYVFDAETATAAGDVVVMPLTILFVSGGFETVIFDFVYAVVVDIEVGIISYVLNSAPMVVQIVVVNMVTAFRVDDVDRDPVPVTAAFVTGPGVPGSRNAWSAAENRVHRYLAEANRAPVAA